MASPGHELELELMVDTGAAYSRIAKTRLQEMGISSTGHMRFQTIRGEIVERDIAPVLVAVNGRAGGDTVVMAEAGDMEVWGAHTLEAMGMTADLVNKKLVPLPIAYALAANRPGRKS